MNVTPPLPKQTTIYHSRLKPTLLAAGSAALLIAGLYLTLSAESHSWFDLGLAAAGAVGLFFGLKPLLHRKPQIVLSREGIGTSAVHFHPWTEVRDLFLEEPDGSDHSWLCYLTDMERVRLHLHQFDQPNEKIRKLLEAYSGRPVPKKMY